jgi:hypothetical protein
MERRWSQDSAVHHFMTRRRMLIGLIGLIVIVAGASRLLTGSGEPEGTAMVTVGQLWQHASQYEGKRVETEGVVRIFSPGPDEYFVIEQAGQYRVGLRGPANSALEALVGQTVTVKGVVHFKEGFGYYIEVGQLTPRSASTPGDNSDR